MKITIHSTDKIINLVDDTHRHISVPARLWEGTTESGVPVHCFITRIAPTISKTEHPDDPRFAEFERELQEQEPPSVAVANYSLRLIL